MPQNPRISFDDLPDDEDSSDHRGINLDSLPDQDHPQQQTQAQPEQRGLLSNIWHRVSDPLTDAPSRLAQSVSDYITTPSANQSNFGARARGFVGGALEGVGNLASGFTSPLNIATLAATGGGSALAGAAPNAARILNIGGRILSAPVAAHGAYEAVRPGATAQERAFGVMEAAGGMAGMMHTPSARHAEIPPERATPAAFADDVSKTTPPTAKPPVSELDSYIDSMFGDKGGSGIELVNDDSPAMNASGESAASAEAMSRNAGMKSRGEQFVVYDRAGNERPLIGPDAVDYHPAKGETYGVKTPDGFRTLTDNGGKVNFKPIESANESAHINMDELPDQEPKMTDVDYMKRKTPLNLDYPLEGFGNTDAAMEATGLGRDTLNAASLGQRPANDLFGQIRSDIRRNSADALRNPIDYSDIENTSPDVMTHGRGRYTDMPPQETLTEPVRANEWWRRGAEPLDYAEGLTQEGTPGYKPIEIESNQDTYNNEVAEKRGLEEDIADEYGSKIPNLKHIREYKDELANIDLYNRRDPQVYLKDTPGHVARSMDMDWMHPDSPGMKPLDIETGLNAARRQPESAPKNIDLEDLPHHEVPTEPKAKGKYRLDRQSGTFIPIDETGKQIGPTVGPAGEVVRPELTGESKYRPISGGPDITPDAEFGNIPSNVRQSELFGATGASGPGGPFDPASSFGDINEIPNARQPQLFGATGASGPGGIFDPPTGLGDIGEVPSGRQSELFGATGASGPGGPFDPPGGGGDIPSGPNPNAKQPNMFGDRPEVPASGSKLQQGYDLARSLMSVDPPFVTSAAFRQASPLIGTKAWRSSWIKAAKAYGSEATYNAIMDGIKEQPLFKPVGGNASYAEQVGLRLGDLTSYLKREEFIKSELAEKIPLYGKMVRASNRAYTAFLNTARADTFANMIQDLDKMGMNPKTDLTLGKAVADYVNTATGTGKLSVGSGGYELNLEKNAKLLSNVFFSPRKMAAELQMLNPANYLMGNPYIRKQYLASMVRRVGTWWTMAGLAYLAGAKVSTNPTNPDFGKIRIGDTRIDPPGGLQQYLVLGAQMARGGKTSSNTGQFTPFGQGYKPETAGSTLAGFATNRFHPTAKAAWDIATASKDKPFHLGDRMIQAVVPMFMDDLTSVVKEHPELAPLILGAAGTGMGTQTYDKGSFGKPTYIPQKYDLNFGRR